MTPSTLHSLVDKPVPTVGARAGENPGHPADPAPPAPDLSPIRMAGLADIPSIARITQEGPQPEGIEPAVMSRATRLLLTHVAFEHGALWVEQPAGGPIVRAVIAIPAGQLPQRHRLQRQAARQLGKASTPAPLSGFSQELLDELTSAGSLWLLIEISKASHNRLGDPALLSRALRWARTQSGPHAPVMVLTDTMPERTAAESLGFVERRTGGLGWLWWLGVAAPEASMSGS